MKFFSFLLLLTSLHFSAPANNGGLSGVATTGPFVLRDDDAIVQRNRRPVSSASNSGSSDPIVFPANGPNSSEESHSGENDKVLSKSKKIPLKFLRELSLELNLTNVFAKYVQNVKVKDVKGQTLLINLQGQPINAGVGVIEPTISTTISPPSFAVFGATSFGNRPVAPLPERRPAPNLGSQISANSKTMSTNTRVSSVSSAHRPVADDLPERIAQGGNNVERISKPALCEPELKTVPVVPNPADPSIIHFPSCVRIPQCGGCCISNLLTCEPVEFKPVEIQIQKLLYKSESELEYVGTDKITMRAHTQCKCGCSIKPEDCSSNHFHDGDQCLCICKNQNESNACHSHELKIWSTSNCKCECREARECNSGYVFSPESCTCKAEVKNSTNDSRNRNRREHRRSAGNLQIQNKFKHERRQ